MRADRLLAILMFLQTHGRTTVHRLATEFEVSRRTLLRDIYALRVAGFPVDTSPGPGGGCSLPDAYRNRLTGLKEEELAALLLSSTHQPLKELGLSEPLRAAQLKLAATTAGARREALQQFARRVAIDSTPWPGHRDPQDVLSTLFQACMQDRLVCAEFKRSFGIVTTHRIAPYGLVSKGGTWHCIWSDGTARFRVDRVVRFRTANLADRTFTRSAEFDVQTFWESWLQRQTSLEPAYEVLLRVRADAIEFVRDTLRPADVLVCTPGSDRSSAVEMIAAFSYFDEARSRLLPLGSAVEVLKPRALRASIADFALQIASQYTDEIARNADHT